MKGANEIKAGISFLGPSPYWIHICECTDPVKDLLTSSEAAGHLLHIIIWLFNAAASIQYKGLSRSFLTAPPCFLVSSQHWNLAVLWIPITATVCCSGILEAEAQLIGIIWGRGHHPIIPPFFLLFCLDTWFCLLWRWLCSCFQFQHLCCKIVIMSQGMSSSRFKWYSPPWLTHESKVKHGEGKSSGKLER